MPIELSGLTLRDYGRIRINLKERMDAEGITRYALAKKVATRFEVIDKWYSGEVERIDLDVLARICFVMHCKIEDILIYEVGSADRQ